MRVSRRLAVLSAVAVTAATLTATAHAAPVPDAAVASPSLRTSWPAVPVAERLQPWLADRLVSSGTDRLRVMVSGETTAAAQTAATRAGLQVQQVWDKVGIVVAAGTPAQVEDVVPMAGIRNVSGDQPMRYTLDTAHEATRSDLALLEAETSDGSPIDGTGVTVAVIDSGIDGTHPFFQKDGQSKVVRNLKNVCGVEIVADCFQQDPSNDTDTKSAGGHGTHVAGIVAGYEVTTTDPAGTQLRGAAPGAKLVGLSVGAAIGLLDATAAMYWVVEHQQNPCRSADEQTESEVDADCPPIRATNHSYGPATAPEGGFEFDPDDPAVTVQRTLVEQGVTVNWAAGNSGGDGSIAQTNPPAMDPTPGVVMVASYDDAQSGARDNQLSGFSSRGKDGDPGTYPDLSAPGDLITSACRPTLVVCQGAPSYDGGDYQTISGTSMAAPYVAGVAAQLAQADPGITPGQVEDLLEDTAHKFTAGGGYEPDPRNSDDTTSYDKGHGLVDVLAVLAKVQGRPEPDDPATEAAPTACGGTDLVTDPDDDAAAPLSGEDAGTSQDLTAVSFAAQEDRLTVELDVENYTGVPAPGTASSIYLVSWAGPDGTRYAVRHQNAGGDYQVGVYEGGNTFKEGTASDITGEERSGPGGGITFFVPRDKVGNPVIPVTDPVDAGVTGPVGEVYGSEGTGATGGLYFVAPMDRAPNGGEGASWSVCAASGGTPTTGGDTASPTPSSSPSPTASPEPSLAGAGFHSLTPTRLLDTREQGAPVAAGADRMVEVAGRAGMPSTGVSGVVVNTTVTGVEKSMDLMVFPSDARPSRRTSNLNAVGGQTVANLVEVALGEDGRIGLSVSTGSAHVVLDVVGWYAEDGGDGYVTQEPVRRFDSRASSPISAGDDRVVPLFEQVPAGVTSAVVSLTALDTTGPTDVGLYANGDRPDRRTSNLNLSRGETRANLAVVPVDEQGRVAIRVSSGSAHVVLDLMGWYVPDSTRGYVPLRPSRILDTRLDGGPVKVGDDRAVTVLGDGGVPTTDVEAVLVNVTSVGSSTFADLQVYPSGDRPARRTSNLNVRPGQTVPVLVAATVGDDGRIVLSTSQGEMDVVLDVVGYVRSGD